MFKIHDEPETPKGGRVFKIYDEPKSPNEGGFLRHVRSRDLKLKGVFQICI